MTNGPQWTPQQRAGITTVGHSLLVSAAAGSGKTAVLAERCAHLVCDAEMPCDVDELLVVTFTESAAAEMKTRIGEALRRRLAARPSERLRRQVQLAQRAHVSTLHSFCRRLLAQNFTLAGIDPDFRLLDAEEAILLRQEIAEDVFHRRYENDEEGHFQRLIDAYADGKDESLAWQVVKMHGMLASLLNPQKWIADNLTELERSATDGVAESTLGRLLVEKLEASLAALEHRAAEAQRILRRLGDDFGPYVQYLEDLAFSIKRWQEVLEREGIDRLAGEIRGYDADVPKLPHVRAEAESKKLAQSLVYDIRNAIREGAFFDLATQSSEQWQDGMRRVLPHARTLLELVGEFGGEYEAAKAQQRALDFADLERLSLKILTDAQRGFPHPSALARSLHGQFRFVLVDEYQDINPIQDAILQLVSRECLGERDGNLFCVGDVKQSIFRFRLAEPARFLERHRKFSSGRDRRFGEVIDLRENFRSRGLLLEAINGVFERLMRRRAAEIEYDESHRLAPGRVFPTAGGDCFAGAPLELHLLPGKFDDDEEEGSRPPGDSERIEPLERSEYEAILAARRIRELMGLDGCPRMQVCRTDASGQAGMGPIEFGDIAVLLRSLQQKADRFADILRAHGIPVRSEAGGDFFQATEVRDVMSLLEVLDNQQQDIPLAAVLRSPLGGLPMAEDCLARIRLAYPSEPEAIAFHQAVVRYGKEQTDELAAHLRDFLSRLARWRDLANKRPVAELLWTLYDETSYLCYCGGLEDGEQRAANLLFLHEKAAQFGGFLRQGLYRFLRFLQSLQADVDLSRPSLAGQTANVVRIMSIHRSKGLEFPVVILPDLGKQINFADSKGAILIDRQMGLGMEVVDEKRLIRYPSLASALVESNLKRQTIAEEMRLLYVALTRAKEHAILIATCNRNDIPRWEKQWTGHDGALPADVVADAGRIIDWIGPVAAMTADQEKPIFQTTQYAVETVRQWKNPRFVRKPLSDRQQRMVEMRPLENAPPPTAEARQVIERFEKVYPFEAFTRLPAASSVTALVKGGQEAPIGAAGGDDAKMARKLDWPRFFQKEAAPKATDIGNATHAVLEYFDFAEGADPAAIERQIQSLVDRKLLSGEDARLVDREAVAWFLETDVGRLIRENASSLLREAPFALLQAAEGTAGGEAGDRTMVRGRIDLLVETPPGVVIVDYKTDRVSGEALEQRVELYGRQMKLYAAALEEVARKKVSGIYLVFLAARQVRLVGQSPSVEAVAPAVVMAPAVAKAPAAKSVDPSEWLLFPT